MPNREGVALTGDRGDPVRATDGVRANITKSV